MNCPFHADSDEEEKLFQKRKKKSTAVMIYYKNHCNHSKYGSKQAKPFDFSCFSDSSDLRPIH